MYLEHDITNSSELSSGLKHFLRVLAEFANHDGLCWPSQKTIAQRMSASTRQVRRYLSEAVELRFVEVRRRWRKSNVYRILCLKPVNLFTMRTSTSEQNSHSSKNQRWNAEIKPSGEIRVILDDISQVMGGHLAEKNRKWFRLIARKCSYEAVQDALARVKQSLMESEIGGGGTIRNPSGLLTWLLRQAGQPI